MADAIGRGFVEALSRKRGHATSPPIAMEASSILAAGVYTAELGWSGGCTPIAMIHDAAIHPLAAKTSPRGMGRGDERSSETVDMGRG